MNLASIYIAVCIASIGVTVIPGALDCQSLALLSALFVSIVGVPHGGLDHWTGRRLLFGRLRKGWWIVFFPVYLAIAGGFAIAWYMTPIVTVLLFFIISAWHFGREDERASDHSPVRTMVSVKSERENRPSASRYLIWLRSIAVGGLVIWIPSLFRPEEMGWLLSKIIPTSGTGGAQQVLLWTHWFSLILVPIAGFVVVKSVLKDPGQVNYWVPLATVAIGICTPILLSFTIYFCAWHSIQGLRRLQREEQLTNLQFAFATLPLSAMAVAGIAFVGWFFQDTAAVLASGEQAPVLQTLFIGLSAIAVPHLLLHEIQEGASHLESNVTWELQHSCANMPSVRKGTAS